MDLFVDMEKFPLRLKDESLLVSSFYQDPKKEAITAMSVYMASSSNGIYFFSIKKR